MMSLILAVLAFADTDIYVKDHDGSFHKLSDTEAARNLEPERFAPFACAKMVEHNRDWILKQVADGYEVHCEMNSHGPLIRFGTNGGAGSHGCPFAVFGNLRQKCEDVHGKVPEWAKEKK